MKGQDISSKMLMLCLLWIILVLNVRCHPSCPPGTYGDSCDKKCSERCRVYSVTKRVYCDKTSGRCAEGCIPGWYYDKCNMKCSTSCIKSVCNHQTGECTIGCIDGKKGTFCETQVTKERPDKGGETPKNPEKGTGLLSGLAVSLGLVILFLLVALYMSRQKIHTNTPGSATVSTEDPWKRDKNQTRLHQGPVIDTTLLKACVDGNLDVVKQVINDDKNNLNTRGLYRVSPLMLAALRGHNDVFEYLHKQGADMTLTDREGDHILSIACVGGNVDIVKYVVSKKPELINRKRHDGRTALMWAAWHGKETIFRYLLKNGADSMLMDNDRDNVLHYACHGGHTGIVEKILAQGKIAINCRDRCGKTAVMEAAEQGHTEVFDILVENSGISHTKKDVNNVLLAACRGGHVKMVEYVLSQGKVDINCKGQDGATPLMFAARGGHEGVFDLLVKEGASAALRDSKGNNILHVACMEGHVEMVQHILSRQMVDINSRGQYGRTPLLCAVWWKRCAVIRLLLDQGAALKQVDDDGNNILHAACETGSEEIVRCVLSQNGPAIDATNHRGETASTIAKRTHNMELRKLLMSQR